jgi:hypothetical protein
MTSDANSTVTIATAPQICLSCVENIQAVYGFFVEHGVGFLTGRRIFVKKKGGAFGPALGGHERT